MLASPSIDKLLLEANEKLTMWRGCAYILLFIAAVVAAFAASRYASYEGVDAQSRFTYGVLLLLPAVLLAMVGRSMLGIAHAYALRAGHLEDVSLYLSLFNEGSTMRASDWLEALVRLRREHIGQMVFQSLPDSQAVTLGTGGAAR